MNQWVGQFCEIVSRKCFVLSTADLFRRTLISFFVNSWCLLRNYFCCVSLSTVSSRCQTALRIRGRMSVGAMLVRKEHAVVDMIIFNCLPKTALRLLLNPVTCRHSMMHPVYTTWMIEDLGLFRHTDCCLYFNMLHKCYANN